jgi:glyoxylate/hydroxypyruvate reductase A
VLVLTGIGRDEAEQWTDALAAAAPNLEVVRGPVEDERERVEFALTFVPAAGEMASYVNLRFVCAGGAGVDGILRDASLPPTLPLLRLVDRVLTARMSEYVVHAVLHHHRRIAHYVAAQARGEWEVREQREGTRVGILGLGALGADAAHKLSVLGFQVAGWSRTKKAIPEIESFTGPDGLRALTAQSDVLVCLLPLTRDTRGIINSALLAELPEGAYVVNPSRGGLVADNDLLAALSNGRLAGAALDVFNEEPLPADRPYWSHPNVAVTPHVASRTDARSAAPQLLDNIRRARSGRPLLNRIDRDRGY